MRAVALLLGKDLRTLRRTPVLLGVLLAYPLVIAALVGLVAGYSSSKPRVAFVDEDGLPARLVVGGHAFNVRTTIDAVAQNVDLVRLSHDTAQRSRLWEIARDVREQGGSVLVATHHWDELSGHADRTLELVDGALT